jgi:hypothetical protein
MKLRLAGVLALAGAVVVAAFPAAAAAEQVSGIVVTGNGSVNASPDVATLQLGVEARARTARAALRDSSKRTARVVAALLAQGVARKDIQTAYVSLFREQVRPGRVVYVASNSVSATVRDIAKVGAVIDAAVDAGANQVGGPQFGLSNPSAQYAQALAEAYDDARAKAEALAAKAGVTLGEPTAVVEGGVSVIPIAQDSAAGGGERPVPIEPGTTQVQATVTVTFAIS